MTMTSLSVRVHISTCFLILILCVCVVCARTGLVGTYTRVVMYFTLCPVYSFGFLILIRDSIFSYPYVSIDYSGFYFLLSSPLRVKTNPPLICGACADWLHGGSCSCSCLQDEVYSACLWWRWLFMSLFGVRVRATGSTVTLALSP